MTEMIQRLRGGSGVALSLLRLVTGFLIAWHGLRKFTNGLDGFEGFLTSLDLPAPAALAVVVALLELVGGIMLAVGLLTRPVALLLAAHFALIFVWVKLIKLDPVLLLGGEQPGVELDILYLVLAVMFLVVGPGAIAVDRMLGIEPEAAEAVPTGSRAAATA